MKKTVFLIMLLCFVLPKSPPISEPAVSASQQSVSFVIEAGRYAWAWADAQYYTCFSFSEKEAF